MQSFRVAVVVLKRLQLQKLEDPYPQALERIAAQVHTSPAIPLQCFVVASCIFYVATFEEKSPDSTQLPPAPASCSTNSIPLLPPFVSSIQLRVVRRFIQFLRSRMDFKPHQLSYVVKQGAWRAVSA
jgi:hypothetical protein